MKDYYPLAAYYVLRCSGLYEAIGDQKFKELYESVRKLVLKRKLFSDGIVFTN